MKSAREMFEKIGYRYSISNCGNFINYNKGRITLTFDLIDKLVFVHHLEVGVTTGLDVYEIQAINKQIEELNI